MFARKVRSPINYSFSAYGKNFASTFGKNFSTSSNVNASWWSNLTHTFGNYRIESGAREPEEPEKKRGIPILSGDKLESFLNPHRKPRGQTIAFLGGPKDKILAAPLFSRWLASLPPEERDKYPERLASYFELMHHVDAGRTDPNLLSASFDWDTAMTWADTYKNGVVLFIDPLGLITENTILPENAYKTAEFAVHNQFAAHRILAAMEKAEAMKKRDWWYAGRRTMTDEQVKRFKEQFLRGYRA
jgi:hypothetical protein